MFNMIYDIRIGKYKLAMLESVEIHKSVDLLTSTATVVVPAVVYNQSLDHEKYVKVGDPITIQLGYDENLVTEFVGYVQRIDTDDDSLTFNCEDSMFLTRKAIQPKQFIKPTIRNIAEYCAQQVGLKLNCSYDTSPFFEKFVIAPKITTFDVLKKLKQDTASSIYIRNNELNVHPPYIEKTGAVVYDFAVNIESSDLKYRKASDRSIEVTVNGIGLDGKKIATTIGTIGGDQRSITINTPTNLPALKQRAENELKYLSYDGYEGSITGWLIPFVDVGYSCEIRDSDYEYKNGTYYVNAVTTSFSADGGVRKVEIGCKLSGNKAIK